MKRIVTTMLATALLAAAGCALMGPEYVEPAEYDLAQPPAAMHRRSQAMFRPSVRMICIPSRSCLASSAVLPWTMGQ